MYRNLAAFAHRLRRELSLRFPFLVPKNRGGTHAYALTIALMGLALFMRLAIAPVSAGLQYVTFFPAVTLAAIFGGYRSGLLATAIGLVFATYIFTPPYYSFSTEVLRLSLWSNLVFLMDGVIVSFSIEAMHRYRQKFEKKFDDVKRSEAQVMKLNEELAEQEEFFRLIAENVQDFIAVLDLQGRRIYNSPSYSRIFDDVEAMKGTDSFADLHPDDRERVKTIFKNCVHNGVGQQTEYRFVLPNGNIHHMESSSGLIKDSQGKPRSVVVVSHDITERKMVEQEINRLAFYDTLTQLPNRRLLDDRLEHAIAACKRSGNCGALMFLDLDNFKPLNDTYGHKAGDLLLIEVSRRLVSCIRGVDTVARFGGDEFVVLLPETTRRGAEVVANRILANLGAGLGPGLPEVGASIGMATCPAGGGLDESMILRHADGALLQAKREGKNHALHADFRRMSETE